MKKELGNENVDITKIAIMKTDVERHDLISNIGYRERMLKPKTLKYHMNKEYVKDFCKRNLDLKTDGIVQYEIEAYPNKEFKALIEQELDMLIDLNIIKNTDEICKAEAKDWVEKHYVEEK